MAEVEKIPIESATTTEPKLLNSSSSSASVQATTSHLESGEVSLDERRAITRKLDIHIIPVAVVLYLVNFLDRSMATC